MQVHRVWPGHPSPLGATWDGSGVNFARLLGARHRRRALSVRLAVRGSRAGAAAAARVHASRLARLRPRPDARSAVRLPGERPVGARQPAIASTRPRSCSIPMRARSGAACAGTTRCSATSPTTCRPATPQDSAPWAPLAAVIDGGFAWGDDRPPATPLQDTVIYELHVRGFTRLHPGVPEHLRGSYLGPRLRAGDRAPQVARRDRGRAPARPRARRRAAPGRPRPDQLLGLQHARVLRPRSRATAPGSQPLDAVREFKMMVRALHAAGLEVILDVVYNHTGEGSHLGPTLAFRGLDNAVYYRLLPGTRGALRGLHRLRQHAERPPPAGAEAGDGQPALLGHRDARRRLPLRPRAGARPRDRQLRSVRGVLRRHPPGPDPVAA